MDKGTRLTNKLLVRILKYTGDTPLTTYGEGPRVRDLVAEIRKLREKIIKIKSAVHSK